MRYKLFGQHTGLRGSELALGTSWFGTTWGYGTSPEEARRIFDRYAEAGGNFIDNADLYQFGESESLLGDLTSTVRDDFVIATKYSMGSTPQAGLLRQASRPRGSILRFLGLSEPG